MNLIAIYLAFINLTSGIIFIYDKYAAKNRHRRIPESLLHILEFLGGVFIIFILMFLIGHKNKKFNYKIWTWILLIWWNVGYVLVLKCI